MTNMHRLPDGSGYFIGAIGPREPGFVNRLKYRRVGSARPWLYLWRNYRSALEISRWPGQGPPLGHWAALRYAWSIQRQLWGLR